MTWGATLRVQPFGDVVDVRPGESALDALLRQGRFVRHGCKHGGCGTCRARLVSGECTLSERTSFSLSDADREAGIVLLCSTYAAGGEAVVDLAGVMELGEDEFRAGHHVAEHVAEVAAIERLTDDLRTVRFH
ncbi:MAG TPA: 2Fe-2S iron-sulfur cluster-binding protein, partial [Kofleriaceae bacterium]